MEVAVRQSVLASTSDLNVLEPLVEMGFNSIRDGDKEFYKRLTTGNDFFNDLQESALLFTGTFTPDSGQANTTSSPAPQSTAVPSFDNARPDSNPEKTSKPSTPPIDSIPSINPTIFSSSNPLPSPVPNTSPNQENQNVTKGPSQPSSQLAFVPSSYPSSTIVPSLQTKLETNVPTINTVPSSTENPVLTAIIISAITIGTLAGLCVLGIGLWLLHICAKKSSQQGSHGSESTRNKNGQKKQRNHQTETIPTDAIERNKASTSQIFFPKVMRLNKHKESSAQTAFDFQTDGSKRHPKLSVLPRRNRKVLDMDQASLDDSSIYTSLSMPIRPGSQFQEDDTIMESRKTGNGFVPSRQTNQNHDRGKTNKIGSPKSDVHGTKHILSNVERNVVAANPISSVKKVSKDPKVVEVAERQMNQNRGEESDSSSNLDFASSDVEDFIFGEEEGMLGAWAPISPIADRHDDWISQAMYDSGSKSGASSSKTSIGITDYDSPLDLTRLNRSNVVIPEDYDLTSYITKSNEKRYIDFDAIASSDFDSVSQSTQSSKTEQISNSMSKDLRTYGTPSQQDISSQYINLDEKGENVSFNLAFGHSSQTSSTSPILRNSFNSDAGTDQAGVITKRGEYVRAKSTSTAYSKQRTSFPHKIVDQSTPTVSRKLDVQSPSVINRTAALSNDYALWSHPPTKNIVQTKPITKSKIHRSLSGSSSSSDGEFLFNVIERTLGPRSASADMESLSGRSNKSLEGKSHFVSPKRGLRKSESRDVLRQAKRLIHLDNEEKKDNSLMSPRTLFYDMQRLGQQLEAINSSSSAVLSNEKTLRLSSDTSPNGSLRRSDFVPQRKIGKKTSVVVVPPGKLGIILASRRGGIGTFIAEVKNSSSLKGAVLPGDRLVAIDGVDVSAMVVAQVTSIMMEKSSKERQLTVLSSTRINNGAVQQN
jgi:type IV secretory pathway protease TraF